MRSLMPIALFLVLNAPNALAVEATSTQEQIKDISTVLPADSYFYMGTPGLKTGITRIRKETALGQLYNDSRLKLPRDLLWTAISVGNRIDAAKVKSADQWLDRFGGPCGLAVIERVWEKKPGAHEERSVVLFGVTGNEPKDDLAAFSREFASVGEQNRQVHRDATCWFIEKEKRRRTLALAGNMVVHSDNPVAVREFIDATLDRPKPNLATTPLYQKACQRLPKNPLGMLYVDMQTMVRRTFAEERAWALAASLGLWEWKHASAALEVRDGLFLEQAFCRIEGERRGLTRLLSMEPATGRLAALCPTDALVFASIHFDARPMLHDLMAEDKTGTPRGGEWLKQHIDRLGPPDSTKHLRDKYERIQNEAEAESSKLQTRFLKLKNPTSEQRNEIDERISRLQERKDNAIRALAGLKRTNKKTLDTLFGNLRGEAAVWLVCPSKRPTGRPDICAAFELTDAVEAESAADALARADKTRAKDDRPFSGSVRSHYHLFRRGVGSFEYKGRKCYTEGKPQEEEESNPFCLSWCADSCPRSSLLSRLPKGPHRRNVWPPAMRSSRR